MVLLGHANKLNAEVMGLLQVFRLRTWWVVETCTEMGRWGGTDLTGKC